MKKEYSLNHVLPPGVIEDIFRSAKTWALWVTLREL